MINPDKGYVLKENDEIIAISEDDDTIVLNSSPSANTLPQHVGKESVEIQKDTKTLILGWNLNGIKIIQELDNYTTNNSEIVIVAELNDGDKSEIEQLSKRLNNLSISFSEGEINDKQTLLALNLFASSQKYQFSIEQTI